MMNWVFFGIVALAFLSALIGGTAAEVGAAALASAKGSVDLAIGLIGYIALFLGLMKVVEEAGGLKAMARLIRPILIRLFPDVPVDHPAMGAMIMNISANALGLGNAATPFGLKAMAELNKLNREQGVATNAMVLFLAINTSGLALIPSGIIGLRALNGSADPAVIFPTTLMATGLSTIIGISIAKFLSRLPMFRVGQEQREADEEIAASQRGEHSWTSLVPAALFFLGMGGLCYAVYFFGEAASSWIIPGLIMGMLTFGVVRGVKVYEVFVAGAKEGFQMAVMIIPYLIAILSAVGMFRASGGLGAVVGALGELTAVIGLPAEVLPLAILRPLSGSGAFALTAELLNTHGPDTYVGVLASTLNGSTETTFYVLAVYFGSVGVSRIRHAVWAGLAADLAGVFASVLAVQLLITSFADPKDQNDHRENASLAVDQEAEKPAARDNLTERDAGHADDANKHQRKTRPFDQDGGRP
jgi:spore maturation protein SpmA